MIVHLAKTGEAEVDALALREGVTLIRADSSLPVPLADRDRGDDVDGEDDD